VAGKKHALHFQVRQSGFEDMVQLNCPSKLWIFKKLELERQSRRCCEGISLIIGDIGGW